MTLFPMILLSAIFGLVAAGAVWWGICALENLLHARRMRRLAAAAEAAKAKAEEPAEGKEANA